MPHCLQHLIYVVVLPAWNADNIHMLLNDVFPKRSHETKWCWSHKNNGNSQKSSSELQLHCPRRCQRPWESPVWEFRHALQFLACLRTKESQDFLMPRMESSQQIDLQHGTVHSLEQAWKKQFGWGDVWDRPQLISRLSCTWQQSVDVPARRSSLWTPSVWTSAWVSQTHTIVKLNYLELPFFCSDVNELLLSNVLTKRNSLWTKTIS